MILTIANLSKSYGDTRVLNQVSLEVDRGNRVGIVGANGVGKTTLFRIAAGELAADTGSVALAPGTRLGYLPQVLSAAPDLTVEQVLAQAQERLLVLEARLRTVEAGMAGLGADLPALLAEYGPLAEEFERLAGYDRRHRVDAVLAGLGIGDIGRDRPLVTLSGGEKTRLGLAALLLETPDLLLLDEPTNHLDFAALGWLEGFLAGFRGALLVISHDRTFLNRTVDAIVEIDEHTRVAKRYAGSYDFFAAAKVHERARWEEEYRAQQEELRELRRYLHSRARQVAHNRPGDGDKLAYNYKGARVEATVARNVRNAEERLRRLEADPIPKPPRPLTINPDFDPAALPSKAPLTLNEVGKRFGAHMVLEDITCSVSPSARIAVVGPNGAGKSTLLKIMARTLAPDAGFVAVAPSAVIGYLDQEQETLPTTGTLYEAFAAGRTGDWESLKTELLQFGLFTYPDLHKPVAGLSAGQKRKLQLARLMAQQANLLLLDEPTNHISLDVLEEFEAALCEFRGPVVAVTHDRRFIERVANQVWELREGRLVRH
jgi:macrolide transport system ATP-binding/permease protein